MDPNKLTRMGRRRFLSTLKSAGFSAAALTGLSQEAVAETLQDDKVPHLKAYRHTNHEAVVEQGAKPVREKVYEAIPREQWERYRTAQRARKKVGQIVGRYEQVAAGVRSPDDGSATKITVSYTINETEDGEQRPTIDREGLADKLPSTVTVSVGESSKRVSRQFPVELVEQRQRQNAYYNTEYRPIPGGCQIERGDITLGTLGCVVYDEDTQSRVMLTAGHVVNGSSTPSEHHQYSASFNKQFGEGQSYIEYWDEDCGTIKFVNFEPSFDLADEGGSYEGRSLMGTLSRSELDRMNTNGESLWMQGRTNGETKSQIKAIEEKQIELFAVSDDGDSGGPYYQKINSDEYYMAGIHAWALDSDYDGTHDDGSAGNFITDIEDWLNVTV